MKILIQKNVALTVMTLEQEENDLSVLVVDGYTKTVVRMLCMMLMEKKNCARCVCQLSNLVCCILAQ